MTTNEQAQPAPSTAESEWIDAYTTPPRIGQSVLVRTDSGSEFIAHRATGSIPGLFFCDGEGQWNRHLTTVRIWKELPPQPASERLNSLEARLAADIRAIDGNHDKGAAELAEQLIARGWHPAAERDAQTRDEERQRISKIKRATSQGCLAAAMGLPLHTVAESGYAARSYCGDAWEAGWEFINGSATWQEHAAQAARLAEIEAELAKVRASDAGMSDRMLAIAKIVESREYSSRMNQLEAIRQALHPLPHSETQDELAEARAELARLRKHLALYVIETRRHSHETDEHFCNICGHKAEQLNQIPHEAHCPLRRADELEALAKEGK